MNIRMYLGEGVYAIIKTQIASVTSKKDIYCGELYKALTMGSDYITLTLNTDGIPDHRSMSFGQYIC